MPRKGENIYKRSDGRWEGRYIKGRKTDGTAKYGYVYAYKYTDVKEKLTLIKAATSGTMYTKTDFHGSLEDWIAYWLTSLVKPNIKESTYSSYENKMRNHILPFLGKKKLCLVKREDIQKTVDIMYEKGMTASSISAVLRVLNSALQKAVDKNLLLLNPCRNVVVPKGNKQRLKAFSSEEQRRIEQKAVTDSAYLAVILACHTGMRIGEISALRWQDIDFNHNMLYVNHTLQRIPQEQSGQKTKIVVGAPKTGTSYRVIPLSTELRSLLEQYKESSDSPYVVSCKGHYAEPRTINYRFHKLLEHLHIEKRNFHCLRHTFATRCLENGVDVATLSALLGHSSAKMTLDVYTDSMMEQRIAAVSKLDRMLV